MGINTYNPKQIKERAYKIRNYLVAGAVVVGGLLGLFNLAKGTKTLEKIADEREQGRVIAENMIQARERQETLEARAEDKNVERGKIREQIEPKPGKYEYLRQYDLIIEKYVNEFNTRHNLDLDPDLIRAMIVVESGSPKDRNGAFAYDPMQIANTGDYALEVLADDTKENTHLIGDFSRLKGKKLTPMGDKGWDYSNTNMNADSSIYGGIGWFIHKATIYDTREDNEGNFEVFIKGHRTWRKAVEGYNGDGDPNYVDKVYRVLGEIKQAENN